MDLARLVIFHTDISAKTHFLRILRTSQFKGVAVHQPVVRRLHLVAVLNLLLKHTVTVTDSAPISRISKCCKRIQEACSQTSQTAVSKSRIRFLVLQKIQVHSHLFQSLFHFCICRHVNQIISQSPSHQKLHRHIIDNLRIILLVLLLRCNPVINNFLFHGIGNCLVQFLLGNFFNLLAKQMLHILLDFFFKCLFLKSRIIHASYLFLSPGDRIFPPPKSIVIFFPRQELPSHR